MTADTHLRQGGPAVEPTTSHREAIHMAGSIRTHSALVVARASDPCVTHANADRCSEPLGEIFRGVIATKTYTDIQNALEKNADALTPIRSAVIPAGEPTRCNLVVHELEQRLHAAFEPLGGETERDLMVARERAVTEGMQRARTRQKLRHRVVGRIKALTGSDQNLHNHRPRTRQVVSQPRISPTLFRAHAGGADAR